MTKARSMAQTLIAAGAAFAATSLLAGCDYIKQFQRVEKSECKALTEHIDEVIVDEVKSAAGKTCKVPEAEVKEHIDEYVEKDCATYDSNQPLKRKDYDCMMKADSAAALDKCYDGIPTSKTTTKTKTVAGVKFKKKEKKNTTTMSKPELVSWVDDEKDAYCNAATPAPSNSAAK
jgi:hypothetical protein